MTWMTWKVRIVIDPAALADKPIIKGTHLAVEFIIDLLAHEWSEDEILGNFSIFNPHNLKPEILYNRIF